MSSNEPPVNPKDYTKEEWRAYVQKFGSNAEFPLETNEIVWIVKPTFRAPLGEFRISKAFPDNTFELIKVSDNTVYPEKVEKRFLKRNPFIAGS